MGFFILESRGLPVSGEVHISGAKNAALPIMAAAVMCGDIRLENCPRLSDTRAAADIIRALGLECEIGGNIFTTRQTDILNFSVPPPLCRKMRSSVLFLAPAAVRAGKAVICAPGGCRLGERPIDMHLEVLEKMGAEIRCFDDIIEIEAKNGFTGGDIYLKFPSVGATETAVMAGAAAKGRTRIFSPAVEPEIEDLCAFLNKAGAEISFGDVIEISGRGGMLGSAEHRIISDRIETGTYMALAAITGGELFIRDTAPDKLDFVIRLLEDMGCIIKRGGTEIYIDAPKNLQNPPETVTAPYPLFPTDMQPQLTALAAVSKGDCLIRENIFEGRYRHIPQLCKAGADIEIRGEREFMIHGLGHGLKSAVFEASDLRCGAALILAAACA
ncbi:MAG: UDP-N-acetylglucosamine 1-carboxyvinyltransferase [Firmicutes bacterium]|nr:UDP-N-acetylglucosamine 1-carboxyvinyltransferase [Bacillota bacterium]